MHMQSWTAIIHIIYKVLELEVHVAVTKSTKTGVTVVVMEN